MEDLQLIVKIQRIKTDRYVLIYVDRNTKTYRAYAYQGDELVEQRELPDFDSARYWANTWINQ